MQRHKVQNRVYGLKKTRHSQSEYRVPLLAGLVRLERTTNDLEGRCSIQLSYSPLRLSLYLRRASLATGETGHVQNPRELGRPATEVAGDIYEARPFTGRARDVTGRVLRYCVTRGATARWFAPGPAG